MDRAKFRGDGRDSRLDLDGSEDVSCKGEGSSGPAAFMSNLATGSASANARAPVAAPIPLAAPATGATRLENR